MKRLFISVLAVVLSYALCTPDAQAFELTANGGFETGDLTGWLIDGDTDYSGVGESSPYTGDYGFSSGSLEGGYLRQEIQTTVDQEYTLSFWMSRDAQLDSFEEPFNSFMVLWDGGWDPLFELQNFSEQDHTFYSISLMAANPESLLSFYFFDSQSFINLDDVSLTAADVPQAPVPVPASMVMLATGLAGLAGLRRKRVRI